MPRGCPFISIPDRLSGLITPLVSIFICSKRKILDCDEELFCNGYHGGSDTPVRKNVSNVIDVDMDDSSMCFSDSFNTPDWSVLYSDYAGLSTGLHTVK
jgi:hypothetical protein